jgi:uncharacterized membrane protein YfcA
MDILPYVIVGFLAQLVDGALGMAYGVTSTTFLLSLGIPPAAASASVHVAEVFTTGVSGISHHYYQNVDRRLLLRLAVPGCVGGAVGAYFLTQVPGDAIRPFIAGYLLIMAALILRRALTAVRPEPKERRVEPLGFVGGLLDAIGGGGWGPVVSSTLIARGRVPRYVVGSVNAAEFFVTFVTSATFIFSIGLDYGRIVLGLLIGGVLAAPLAGLLTKHLPARLMMMFVAIVVAALSVYTLSLSIFGSPAPPAP